MGYDRVVGLGLCVVDHSYLVSGIDAGDVRTRYSERRVAPGGMAGNAMVQVAALGCRAHMLTGLGEDEEGRFVQRALRRAGVTTRHVVLSPQLRTTVAVVLVDDRSGERRFIVPDRRGMEARAPDFELSAIGPRSLLLIDGHFPAQALRAVRRAREVGATVVADFYQPRPGVKRLLPHVDHAIVPLEYVEACGYESPRAALLDLAERTGGRPVVTLGRRGGLYLDGRRVRRYRAHPARVVDTTGAGDAFHGAFCAGLVQGLSFEAALDLGARAAALCCTALGATGRIMTRAEAASALRPAAGLASRGR
jgi:sulfofructose kinase